MQASCWVYLLYGPLIYCASSVYFCPESISQACLNYCMIMWRKLFLYYSWLFYGSCGSTNPPKGSLRSKITRFTIRFCLFFSALLVPWRIICPYYSALLISAAVRLAQIFTTLPPLIPELLEDNTLYLHIDRIWIHLDVARLTGPIPIFVSLMLSSSAIALISRMKAILLGISVIFCCQSVCTLCIVYEQLYCWYHRSIQQGINMSEILEYNPDGMGFGLNSFYIILSNDLLLLSCLWAILVCCHKRPSDTSFPVSLL